MAKGKKKESQLERALSEIERLKGQMVGNIEALLTRGDKLEGLKGISDDLEAEAKLGAEQAYKLKRRAKQRYLSFVFILMGLSAFGIYTIIQGYATPIILASMLIGGSAGYAVNWLRRKIVDLFSPTKFAAPEFHEPSSPKLNDRKGFLRAYSLSRMAQGHEDPDPNGWRVDPNPEAYRPGKRNPKQ